MNDLIALQFGASEIRWVLIEGEPWWVGVDVAQLLEIRDRYQALRALEDYERGMYIIPTPSGDQQMIVINESGLYSLLMKSRKPTAKSFKKWLTTQVLPSIRKFGQYPPPQFALEDPDRAQDRRSTPQERFVAECQRIAAVQGVTVEQLLKHIVSPYELRAIVMGKGPMDEVLHRNQRWNAFTGVGMDLNYVLRGIWTHTPQERRMVTATRREADRLRIEG